MSSVPKFPTTSNSDGASILDVAHNQITVLNPAGEFIWTRLQRGVAIEDIIGQLSEQTNTNVDIVSRDTRSFLELLAAEHLHAL